MFEPLTTEQLGHIRQVLGNSLDTLRDERNHGSAADTTLYGNCTRLEMEQLIQSVTSLDMLLAAEQRARRPVVPPEQLPLRGCGFRSPGKPE